MQANQLEAKLRFGYYSCKEVRWTGLSETPRRADVWAFVGAVGGDRRYS